MSEQETGMLCDNVNPFNPRHRCTLGLGHPTEVAHTDGDASWLYDADKTAAWMQDRWPEPGAQP